MSARDKSYKTDQENFWSGDFGKDYIGRNDSDQLLASNLNFFTHSLRAVGSVQSCIEFGANIGMNLRALQLLRPGLDAYGVEINEAAAKRLGDIIPPTNVFHESILEFEPKHEMDLALIKGVLIHINPNMLGEVYEKLVASTKRYLLVAEYYNRSPVAIPYRGHDDRLFKRDFAGEILDQYSEMVLLDYGFAYHRDPSFPQDDISWFLLEKTQ